MQLPTPPLALLLLALLAPLKAAAQFGFFDQMFGGGGQGGGGGGGGGGQQGQRSQNVPSDPTFYQTHWDRMRCDKYLCPDTLGMCIVPLSPFPFPLFLYCKKHLDATLANRHPKACVHFPHHCPCAFPANEDKFEIVDAGEKGGHRVCASKGGFKPGETARKVELARKGML